MSGHDRRARRVGADETASTTGLTERLGDRDSGISRRRFLAGTGVTIAAASSLGPLVQRVDAAPASALDLKTIGVSDGFASLALGSAAVATQAFDGVSAANATTLRFPLNWDEVQGAEGLDWSAYRGVHEQIVFQGLKALPVLVGCPADWLAEGEAATSRLAIAYPTGSRALNAFGEFVVEVLKHFSHYGDHIDAVEIWSEPNNPERALISDPREYSRMLSTAALFVDAASSDGRLPKRMTVVSGGLSLNSNRTAWHAYLDRFKSQPFPFSLGVHLYADTDADASSAARYGQEVAGELGQLFDEAQAATGRPVWVTETAVSSDGQWGDDGQVEAVDAVVTSLASRPTCEAIMMGRLFSKSESLGILGDAPAGSALIRADGSPKPALASLAAAAAGPPVSK